MSDTQMDANTKQWSMILHLSVFTSYLVPIAGIIAPIVIWQIKKNELPLIDGHGKAVINWMISSFIYAIISGLLCLVLVGIPMVIALVVMAVAFPIIGGVKANNGELWNYPLSIRFLR